MRRAAIFVPLLAALALSGCGGGSFFPASREIENMELVSVLGVDLTEEGLVRLTADTGGGKGSGGGKSGGEGGSGGEEKSGGSGKLIHGEGTSLAEAVAELMRLPEGREAIFSHTESVIFGEAAARAGIGGYLDFIERSNEMRLGVSLFIAKGSSAGDFMERAGNELGELLRLLERNAPYVGRCVVFTARETAAALARSGAALIMCVRAEAEIPEPCGFALMEKGRLAGYLDDGASAGAALVMNRVRGENFTVETSEGPVTVALRGTRTAAEPVFSGERLTGLRLKIDLTGLAAAAGEAQITDPALRREVEALAAEKKRREAEAAIRASLGAGYDFLGMRDALMAGDVFSSAFIAKGWDAAFPEISAEVTVNAVLAGSYDLEDPVPSGGKRFG